MVKCKHSLVGAVSRQIPKASLALIHRTFFVSKTWHKKHIAGGEKICPASGVICLNRNFRLSAFVVAQFIAPLTFVRIAECTENTENTESVPLFACFKKRNKFCNIRYASTRPSPKSYNDTETPSAFSAHSAILTAS